LFLFLINKRSETGHKQVKSGSGFFPAHDLSLFPGRRIELRQIQNLARSRGMNTRNLTTSVFLGIFLLTGAGSLLGDRLNTNSDEGIDPVVASFNREFQHEATPMAPTRQLSIGEDRLYKTLNAVHWTSQDETVQVLGSCQAEFARDSQQGFEKRMSERSDFLADCIIKNRLVASESSPIAAVQ
jgi:hypothetical protein